MAISRGPSTVIVVVVIIIIIIVSFIGKIISEYINIIAGTAQAMWTKVVSVHMYTLYKLI